MKRIMKLTVFSLLMLLLFNGACQQKQITVYCIGDSTMSNYDTTKTLRRGWAQLLPQFFNENATIHNAAISGFSTKSFIEKGYWTGVDTLIQPGDFVVIQFGHNDSKDYDTTRYAPAWGRYTENLKKFVEESRKRGGEPILATSIVRRDFDTDTLNYTHGDYPDALRKVAADLDVALVDMNVKTRTLVNELGPEKSKEIYFYVEKGASPLHPEGKMDDTHLGEKGAIEVSRLFVEGLREISHPLTAYLK